MENMKNKFLSTLFLLIIFTLQVSAQTNVDSVEVLTLEKAISIALSRNYDLQLARQNVLNAESQIDEAYADVWPTINITGNYSRNIKEPVLFLPPNTPFNPTPNTQTFSIGAKNNFDFSATLNQTLFSLKVNTAIKIADEYSDYYKYQAESTEDEIIFQVKQAFYGVLLSEELVKVSQKNYDVAKANYDNVKAQYNQGVSSEFDLLRSEVGLANAEPILIQAKNNLEMSKNTLKNLLAINLDKDIKVEGKFELEKVSQTDLDISKQILMENNPMLAALSLQESILDRNISLQKAEYFPVLSGFANYTWQAQDNTFKFNNYNWANTIAVGLTLSIPVFDGFRRSARVEQAEIQKVQIQITKSKTREGLEIQLLQAELKMKEANERVIAQKKSVNQAERALEIAQTRYKNGIGTQLEILDTQNSLVQTQVNYSQAIYDFLIAKADWERIIGKSNNDFND